MNNEFRCFRKAVRKLNYRLCRRLRPAERRRLMTEWFNATWPACNGDYTKLVKLARKRGFYSEKTENFQMLNGLLWAVEKHKPEAI